MYKYWGILLLIQNLNTLLLFKIDKFNSKNNYRRIPEKLLLICAFFGGSIGAFIGMYAYEKHKTNKWYFRYGIPFFMIIQLFLFIYLRKFRF